MDAAESEAHGHGTLRCAKCAEVIGVYEPLVYVIDGVARVTSRAAEPELTRSRPDACYHRACSDLDGEAVTVA